MILKTRDNREVEATEFEFGSELDDCHAIIGAVYVDTGEKCSEKVCMELTEDNFDKLLMEFTERQIAQAEAYYEGDR